MRYLLVGNGPSEGCAVKAKHADEIIQINSFHHIQRIPLEKTSYVAITNMGSKATQQIITAAAKMHNTWTAHEYTHIEIKNLPWKMYAVPFFFTLQLERRLLELGMPPSCMPSTGMIAYHWLKWKLRRGDSLDIAGFTFEGWEGHPWAIEKTLVKGVYPLGYRGDPSYEKHVW
jgi:hypothetical protein